MITKTIIVPEMRNQQEAERVNRVLHDVWGIISAELSWERGEATVHFDELATSISNFEEALLEEGYQIVSADAGARVESLHDWRIDE